MWINSPNARIDLAPQRALRLTGARGALLRAVAGTVWITIDHDPRDIVLDPGESFRVDSREAVVAMPLGARATLELCSDEQPRPRAPQPRPRFAPWLQRLWPLRLAGVGPS